MSAFETLMWRAEADPKLRSTSTIVELLDCSPDWDRLMSAHEAATRLVPRLAERVVETPLAIVPPVWATDDRFDLRYHVRRTALPGPGTFRQLLDATRSFAETPMDRKRPLWESMLVDGLEGDQSAYVFKFNHSLTDGYGLLQLLSVVHGTERERQGPRPEAPVPRAVRHSATGLLAREAAGAPAGAAGAALRSLRRGAAAMADPIGSIKDGVGYTRSLMRVMSPLDAERSPLLSQDMGLGWQFVAHDVPLADLRAGAKQAGGSLNDGFVAALLGALRLYHEHFGVSVDRIPVGVPVSIRSPDDPLGGNQFAAATFAAPIGEVDPRERIRLVREFVLEAREEPAIGALNAISPTLSRLPTGAIVQLVGGVAAKLDLQASNVRGLERPAYVAGARVTRFYAFGPRPGCAAMVSLVSHDGTCCVAGNINPAAITDVELFERCLRDGFDEIVGLARPRHKANGADQRP
jgi:WS/DGAT/MGAT family acyltransferase